MNDIVDKTLKEWRRSPFIYGHTDCLLSLAGYAANRGWPDIRSEYVGRYETHDQAEALLADLGGLDAVIDAFGVQRISVADARRGDVVTVRIGDQKLGALCTGDGIAARLERGTIEINMRLVDVISAWRI